MRHPILLAAFYAIVLTAVGMTDDQTNKKTTTKTPASTSSKAGVDQPKDVDRPEANESRVEEEKTDLSAEDEKAILATAETYKAAFAKGNAKAAAEHFTATAEYVDANGTVYRGQKAIEDQLKEFFDDNPESQIILMIESLRNVTPGLVIEDGATAVVKAKDPEPLYFSYTAVHVKQDGRWLTASVRERNSNNARRHRAQLQQLDWMIGEWIHEGDDAMVRFSCYPVDDGRFLVRNFTVHIAGQETMTGTQRIGWDAQSKRFRAWVFDSDGGFAEGCWHRDGDQWILKLSGVTADGNSASNTSIYTVVDARTMTFQSVDHEFDGEKMEDSEPVTIVRQSPIPESASTR